MALVCAFDLNAQTSFREATVNTVIPKLQLKSLVDEAQVDSQYAWTLEGEKELNFMTDSACMFYDDTWIVSPEINAEAYSDLELHVTMTAWSYSSFHNYPVSLIYSDGSEQDLSTTMDVASKEYKTFVLPLDGVKEEAFRISIKGPYQRGHTSGVSITLIKDVYVCGKSRLDSVEVDVANTSVSLHYDRGYDYCLIDMLKAERNASNIDTLYFNDFTSEDLRGATTNAESTKFDDSLHAYKSGGGELYISMPLVIGGITDSVYVDLKASKRLAIDTTTYNIVFDDEVVYSFKWNRYDAQEWRSFSFSFMPSSRFGTLKVAISSDKEMHLYVDDIFVYQKSLYSYRSLPGFPKTVTSNLVVEDLNCNEEYRVLLQYFKNQNEFGEEVVSPLQDFTLMTNGEHRALQTGETLELEEDFEGSIVMDATNAINGNWRVMGELCYAFAYRTDEWEAIGLPFKPRLLGAFIGGKPYYLRENVDYHLQTYASDADGGFSFQRQNLFDGFVGYLLKVPSSITQYDDNLIYIYSEKGVELNAERQFSYSKLFTHVANPYTYTVDNAWQVFATECLYKYDGSVFRLYTVNDVIRPFESVIVYNGNVHSAPKLISPDGSSSVIDIDNGVFVSVYDDSFAIHNYSGDVTVFSVSGTVVYKGYVNSGEQVRLQPGVYVVNYGGNNRKIVI